MAHILSGKQFCDKQILDKLFAKAAEFQSADQNGQLPKPLAGKIVANIFYETSTRTRLSFEAAAIKLGAQNISVTDPKTSSASKGESLEDSVKVISGYSDILVLRHPENGAAEKASTVSSAPVINAGDGFNEHPTQALLDLYAMQKELGKIDGLKIAFLADMRYQRNIHSLCYIFPAFKNVKLYLIGPKELALPDEYKKVLQDGGVEFEELENLDEVISEIDILYIARVFKERFQNPDDYERLKKSFFVDASTVSKMKKDSAILHVMPRVFEMDTAVDADPRAAYFRQAKNGMYVRMALLMYGLGQL